MKLLPILTIVLGELGVGTALFVCFQQTHEIRKSFFSFQSWLVTTCFLMMSIVVSGNHFFGASYFPLALLAALAAHNFSAERYKWGKGLLFTTALLGTVFLTTQTYAGIFPRHSWIFRLLNMLAGICLLGWADGNMILGHWYLLMRGLSFSHFQVATTQLSAAIIFRTMVLGIALSGLVLSEIPNKIQSNLLFFSMRVVWGLILPAIFGFMAWRCAKTGSNQAGTGLLYITEVSVLIGEISATSLGL